SDNDVFSGHSHGRSVLSCMAAILEGQLIGTAPQADYVLLRTEDADSEYIVEEDNWIAGAELADSIGCDVLNTSLGYTRFNDPTQDHHPTELDGNSIRISIAAGIASQKGMIPVVSAGNSGSSDWYYISAPADAHDILAVGAVGDVGNYAPFSSHGPSADGRVKPDVVAMGWGTLGVNDGGDSTVAINGTSFASPLVAGLVACLWQLHPQRTAQEIMQAVRESASLFDQPNDSLGHGIPNFMLANDLLISMGIADLHVQGPTVFPVPFTDELNIAIDHTGKVDLTLHDLAGRIVWSRSNVQANDRIITLNDPKFRSIGNGTYLLALSGDGLDMVKKVVKSDH
ncbi:MAG: S8 family peptidase, partial [Bacteroidota bacterium]|nr:S8 family peptidase [Bacteroidota bacterium]